MQDDIEHVHTNIKDMSENIGNIQKYCKCIGIYLGSV